MHKAKAAYPVTAKAALTFCCVQFLPEGNQQFLPGVYVTSTAPGADHVASDSLVSVTRHCSA